MTSPNRAPCPPPHRPKQPGNCPCPGQRRHAGGQHHDSKALALEVALIDQLSHYIINSGGKRLRPILVLLAPEPAATAANAISTWPPSSSSSTPPHCCTTTSWTPPNCAAAARPPTPSGATKQRAGRGFLYSRSFEMMVEVGDMRVMEIMAQTTNTIAEGEVLQLLELPRPVDERTELSRRHPAQNRQIIRSGLATGCRAGPTPAEEEQALAAYGRHLGNAFQLIDDVLD